MAFADAAVGAFPVGALLAAAAATAPLVGACSRAAAGRWGDAHAGAPPLKAAVAFLAASTAAAPWAIGRGPRALALAFVFAGLWGGGMSFYYALLRPVCFFIVPPEQASKFTGLFSFAQVPLAGPWRPIAAALPSS